jgi:endogenous inhibitor of DNA gyrase (YacG/DUF329 family)
MLMSPDTTTMSKTCPVCWSEFTATGRNAGKHTYCSTRCRRTAFERRRAEQPGRAEQPASLLAGSPETTGPRPWPAAERTCPHCGGLVTIVALLTTPEAARPALPAAPTSVIPLHRI